jgi:hypothetical protein
MVPVSCFFRLDIVFLEDYDFGANFKYQTSMHNFILYYTP